MIAAELFDSFVQRLRDARTFRLDHHHRNAVHQHHDIGDDEALAHVVAGWAIDTKLVSDGKAVGRHIVPGDVTDCLAASAVPAGQALDCQAFEEQSRNRLVCLHQPSLPVAGQGADRFGKVCIIEPGPAIRAGIDRAQALAQGGLTDDLPEADASCQVGVILAACLPDPAHGNALVDKGLFDIVIFMSH
ncbi:hypothetical protein GLUCOINTEAF2_0203793 [Komagataeibacter intermedius AF2]|uniref:Uncharacterized protein n=1 Tax=Komagataeibacter intermedius AF2 TaxID=1458464 RepID=A0A0N1N5U9_9PROT|nr:hypothetical protein GLUCOINTEAF2_0203793 [Komagataeibacter intermedius AF2]